jgi:hypothetical protein
MAENIDQIGGNKYDNKKKSGVKQLSTTDGLDVDLDQPDTN